MTRVLRSMLYVPANNWRMIVNAASEGADAIILDLEDGCPMDEKETGRIFSRDAIPGLKESGVDVFVRVNALETDLTETDIGYVLVQGIDGIMLAKTESRDDVLAVDRILRNEEDKKDLAPGSTPLIALIETPSGIVNLTDIIQAGDRMIAVGFGAGDFSREMGAGMGVTNISPDDYFPMILYARSAIAVAARAAGIQAIDTPYFGLVIDLQGLKNESQKVKLLGFHGKQLTHPRHVATVNAVFSPTDEEKSFARRVVEAYGAAKAKGLGATTLGGKMIDYGSFKRAEAMLSTSQAIEEKERRTAGVL